MNTHPNSDAGQYGTPEEHRRVMDVVLPSPNKQKQQHKKSSFLGELFRFGVIAVLVVVPIRLYVAQPFIVSGASMEPTFSHGEYLIIDEISYRFNTPERGDVIVFKFPEDTSKFFIKRVIGLPSETVSIQNGHVRVTSNTYPNGVVLEEPYIVETSHDTFTTTLGNTEYFVLGDNRLASSDSRIWGPLEGELIVGRAFLRLLPIARASVLPGDPHSEK